jgi:2-polyprenyl-6-methoxyphenol hydroxylase-like FAD-dependent oxidoreductase
MTFRHAAFGLALNGQAALQEICPCLLQELKEIGIALHTGGYMLPWYRVRDGLLERAREASGVIISFHTSVVSTFETENGVLIRLETVCDGNTLTKEMMVDLVVGADGVHSSIRKMIGAPLAVSSHTKCWRGALNDLPPSLSHVLDIPVAKMIKTESGWFSIFNFNTSLKGFVSWVATSKNLDNTTPLEMLDGIATQEEEEMARGLLEASTQQELKFSTILSTIPMEHESGWGGKGRITLIGDSAHCLRPASGLGGSLALEDAAVLTRCIIESKKAGESIDKALQNFENKRFIRCKTTVDDQTRIAEAGYGKNDTSRNLTWTPEYQKWLFMGPDATPTPPDSVYQDVEEELKRKSVLQF